MHLFAALMCDLRFYNTIQLKTFANDHYAHSSLPKIKEKKSLVTKSSLSLSIEHYF